MNRREKIIDKCNRIHNNKYDYSDAVFDKIAQKVVIKCPIHGVFQQILRDHARGHGCSKCHHMNTKTWSTTDDEYIRKYYKEKGAKECSQLLEKTLSAVYSGASILGIVNKIPQRKFKELPNNILNQIKNHAKSKNREMTLTEEDIMEIYEKQNRKCALSGWDITFTEYKEKASASIDRKDCSKGYTKDNIQITHVDVNLSKRIYSDEYYIKICKAVAKHNSD